MNEHKTPRGNKARNDKSSILADAKNLLVVWPYHGTESIHRKRLVALVGLGPA